MNERVLQKLEWPLLIDILAGFCHTEEGKERCTALQPSKSRAEIETRWGLVDPLKRLAGQGYRAPIGELLPMGYVFRAASLGQTLDGPDLRAVANLLEATRKVYGFASDFAARCSTLGKVHGQILPLPQLQQAINKAIAPDGQLNDDASEELTRIRKAQLSVRKRIEEQIKKLLHDSELTAYLQDDFFTVRNERYVVPMRLDGRGRIKGSILDTSDSGQTLFIEPAQITPVNDQLQELELEEKLEILRIFRELSAKVAGELPTLRGNYDQLVELDVMTAEGQLASELDAGPVVLAEDPLLELVYARHPLLKRTSGKQPVANSITLDDDQHVLIISGPNAGGKTVVLKTVGMLHLMLKAGLLIPADPTTKMYLFGELYLEMGDAQNLTANLSTFSGHLLGLKPILEKASSKDLVLLDELAVGTDPQTAAAIGTAILESLADRKAVGLVTTHFDALKGLAVNDRRFRNGSMEFSLHSLKPTYRLILDVPGQSYGLEVAENMGLPAAIIARAKELRGQDVSSLDKAVTQLMHARDESRTSREQLERERLEAQAEKVRWQQEVEMLQETRRKTAQQLKDKYEDKIAQMRAEFDETLKRLKQTAKESEQAGREALLAERKTAEQSMRNMEGMVNELATQAQNTSDQLPGRPPERGSVREGSPVYVLPLRKTGKVLRLGVGGDDTVEVEVGIIKLRVSLQDLRTLSPGEASKAQGASGPASGKGPAQQQRQSGKQQQRPAPRRDGQSQTALGPDGSIGFVMQTSTNSLDLRGKDLDDAIRATWNFLDRALLRGEDAAVIIHGHGEGTLKAGLRHALRANCPYDIRFRPGMDQEGGDGVTIVALKT